MKSLFTSLDILCVNPNVLAKAQTHHNKIIKQCLCGYYIFKSQTRRCLDDVESGVISLKIQQREQPSLTWLQHRGKRYCTFLNIRFHFF